MRVLIAAALAALLAFGSVPAFANVPEAALAGDTAAAAADAATDSTGNEGSDASEDATGEKENDSDAALLSVDDLASGFAELASNSASFVNAVLGENLGTQTIQDGIYVIESADNDYQVLDVMGASTAEGANVALYYNTNDSHQKFEVTYLGDGTYSIIAQHSGQALDVVASGTENGTNVTQWPWTGTDNQRWIIEDAGDGWYRIKSKCSGLYLDVEGGYAGDSVNIQTWEATDNNGGLGQLFRFSRMVDDGYYIIASNDDSNQVLDVVASSLDDGANVTLWDRADTTNQKFQIYHLYGHYYKVANVNSWKALDVVAGGQANGTNVTQWSQYDTDNQAWRIEVDDDGVVTFQSAANGLYLDVEGGYAGRGVNVWTWEATDNNGGLGQQWVLEEVISVELTISDGVYVIANAANENQVLDVVSGSQEEGANVTLWDYTNVQWQRFRITSVGNGLYRITPLHSGQALDVVASGTASGTNVTQWGWWETDNQLWSIVSYSDGSVSFVSSCNGLALAIDGEAVSGANVQVETYNSNDRTQRWILNECSTRDSFKIYLDAGHGWSSSVTGVYDPGAQALGYVEAELTVDLVNRIAEICQNEYGLCVYSNAGIGGLYWERHPEAVDLGCSTFLSIHFNSGGGTGSESYIHSYNAASGSAAFQDIMHSWLLFGTGLTDRGQKSAALAVTGGSLPSVLLEICFLDSISDMMTYNENIDRIAAAIALGISEAADDPTCQL